MDDKQYADSSKIRRRTVLKSAAAASAAGLVGVPAFSGSVAAESDLEFRIEQDGEVKGCITPLSYSDNGSWTIDEFYNFCDSPPCPDKDNDGGANTPTDIEQEGYSLVFFYEGPGGVSLVMIHDEGDDGFTTNNDFKQTEFSFGGLPTGDSWVVQEDRETSAQGGSDVYENHGSGSWTVSWDWRDKWSDGGAFGYLDDDCESLEITIDPDFSGWSDSVSVGPFQGWKALSGPGATNLSEISLDPDKPITITCGCCESCTGTEKLVKYEWEDDQFVTEGSDAKISLTGVTLDEDGEPSQACFSTDYCSLDVVVKAGQTSETYEDVSGDFCVTGIESETGGGQTVTHAISNIRFYCDAPDDPSVGQSGGKSGD